ncbi:hypothetical protein FKW77_004617 [Venturia effusa]|uniref:Uncharacterized protein n=1 Tax=Venturia effusa TaxID=50376 RepID=A0A517LQ22_9PEZI|nr:hypothetical protein FKW77_004617 [Venturia effusa]
MCVEACARPTLQGDRGNSGRQPPYDFNGKQDPNTASFSLKTDLIPFSSNNYQFFRLHQTSLCKITIDITQTLTMSSNSNSKSTNTNTSTNTATDTNTAPRNQSLSFNQAVRDAGFRNFNDFLLSYGLRVYNHDDVLEGRAILRGMYPGSSF